MPTAVQSLKQKLKTKKSLKKTEIVVPSPEESKRAHLQYRSELRKLVREMRKDVRDVLTPFISASVKESKEENKPIQVADAIGSTLLKNAMASVVAKYRNITAWATGKSTQMVIQVHEDNSKKFSAAVKKATGDVSLGRIISEEQLLDTMDDEINWNVSLVQSIPDQYFNKLNSLIYANMTGDPSVGILAKEIRKLGVETQNRADFIARDQTSKTNGSITKTRQQQLGVTQYIWRTAKDERVRTSHRKLNGKKFDWDKGANINGRYLNPSEDYNCRCQAFAVINLDDL